MKRLIKSNNPMKINQYFNNTDRYKQFTILIPCYNEEETIGTVLANMVSLNPQRIVVVDDGSKDKSAKIIKRIQRISPLPIVLLQNLTNGGAGFALARGFLYCQQINAEYVITVDADNQHSKEDTQKTMEQVLANPDHLIVSGVRKFSQDIPLSKKFSNFCASVTFFLLYGIAHPDPLCGLRSYRGEVLPKLNLEAGYDWVITVNKIIRDNATNCSTVDIAAIYTTYSMAKGQNIRTGIKMLARMVSNRMKEIAYALGIKFLVQKNSINVDERVTMVLEKLVPAYQLNVTNSRQ